MERCDGEIRAKGPELCDGGGDDRISALPDDILIPILIYLLDAAAAARTSVLSTRWRRLWTLLPQLWFSASTDPHGIRAALDSLQPQALDLLDVSLTDATPESLEVWLQTAAHRLSGDLEINNTVQQDEAAPFELPCFENATSICLELGYLSLTLPPLGVFAGLTDLVLACIQIRGPCMLGDVVSSPRCPALRRLTVDHVSGLGNFAIHSYSLLEIKLQQSHDLQQLTIMAPALRLLDVLACFAKPSGGNQPVATISAPKLMYLTWRDAYDPRFTQFSDMENVMLLATSGFLVYGRVGYNDKLHNSYCTGILRRWRSSEYIRVILFFGGKDITNREYLMEDIDITRFPNIRNLILDIMAVGHSCGPSLYHFLKMCTGVRGLSLALIDESGSPEAETACLSGCVCDQPANWKTDEFALNCLRKVKLSNLRGTCREAGLVKRLFDWAPVLETMTVTFDCSIVESKAREFCQMIQCFSRPEICLKGEHFT